MFPYIGLQTCGTVLWVEQVGLMGEFGVLMRLLIGESTQRVGCTADPATTRASDVEPFYGLRQVASSKVGMGARQDDFTVWRGDPVESEVEAVFVSGHQMDDLAGRVGRQMKVDAAIHGVAGIGPIFPAADCRNGIEQTDEVDDEVTVPLEIWARRECSLAMQCTQWPAGTLQYLIGKVSGRGRTTAEAEYVQLQNSDQRARVCLLKGVQCVGYERKAFTDFGQYASATPPKSQTGERCVCLSSRRADTSYIDANGCLFRSFSQRLAGIVPIEVI